MAKPQEASMPRPSSSVMATPMTNMTMAGAVLVKGMGRIMRQAMTIMRMPAKM